MATPVTNQTKTFGDLVDEVSFLLADGEIVFPEKWVKVAINNSLNIVHNSMHREPLDAYFTTSAGVRNYDIPDNRFDGGDATVEAVWVGDAEIDLAVEYDITKSTDTVGTPTEYYILGNTIYFTPVPAGGEVVHVLYRREYVPMTNLTDVVPMSDTELHAGVLYACYLMKLKDEEFQSANAFLTAYGDAMAVVQRFPAGIYSGDNGRMK